MIKYLTKIIIHAHDTSVPLAHTDGYKLILPTNITNKIKLRNSYRRRWQRCRRNYFLKDMQNTLTNEIKSDIEKLRNESWGKNLSKINSSANNNRLWRFINIIKGKKMAIPPLRTIDNTLITPKGKCAAFKQCFEKANDSTRNYHSQYEHTVEDALNTFLNYHNSADCPQANNLFTVKAVLAIIKNLTGKKSTGADSVNNRSLKRLYWFMHVRYGRIVQKYTYLSFKGFKTRLLNEL